MSLQQVLLGQLRWGGRDNSCHFSLEDVDWATSDKPIALCSDGCVRVYDTTLRICHSILNVMEAEGKREGGRERKGGREGGREVARGRREEGREEGGERKEGGREGGRKEGREGQGDGACVKDTKHTIL